LEKSLNHEIKSPGGPQVVFFAIRAGGNDVGALIKQAMRRRVVPVGHDA
jgi:hypothetical protein